MSVTAGRPRLKSSGGDYCLSTSCWIIWSLPWLTTEQEKVSCFEQLGIERDLLPRRIYAGRAKGLIHYFPLKTPVAVGPEAAVFVYVDPGMGTRSELDSWGEAHRRLWGEAPQVGPARRGGCGGLGAGPAGPRRPEAPILGSRKDERGRKRSPHASAGHR